LETLRADRPRNGSTRPAFARFNNRGLLMTSAHINKAALESYHNGVCTIGGAELREDALDVVFHRVLGDAQGRRDSAV
jgi:hypothetical protein